MNLNDKRELVKSKQEAVKTKAAELEALKAKASKAEGDDLKKVAGEVSEMTKCIAADTEEINRLNEEIKTEEKALDEIARKEEERMQKEKSAAGANKTDYLKSKQALEDFAQVLIDNAGRKKEDVKKAWELKLREKGITNPEVMFPVPVVSAIQDTFEAAGTIFATLRKAYGFTVFSNALNTVTDETGRASQHKIGKSKTEQVIDLDLKEIRCDFIYKYIEIPAKVLRETQSTGAVINYVLTELPQRILWEIERASVLGDGRATGADGKITSYEAMVDADATYMTEVPGSGSFYTDLVTMLANIRAQGDVYLVTSKLALAELRTQKATGSGEFMIPIGVDLAAALGVKEIFTPQWFPAPKELAEGDIKAVAYVGQSYIVIGDDTMSNYENFLLMDNQHQYLAELYTGGALMSPLSAAKLTISEIEEG